MDGPFSKSKLDYTASRDIWKVHQHLTFMLLSAIYIICYWCCIGLHTQYNFTLYWNKTDQLNRMHNSKNKTIGDNCTFVFLENKNVAWNFRCFESTQTTDYFIDCYNEVMYNFFKIHRQVANSNPNCWFFFPENIISLTIISDTPVC